MKKSNIIRKVCLASCLGFAAYSTPAFASEEFGHQTLGSSSDVYRIEVRDLNTFKALSTGDGSDGGELKWVEVTLKSGDQVDGYKRKSRDLTDLRGRRGNKTYIKVRKGGKIRLVDRDRKSNNLWIHAHKSGLDLPNSVQLKIRTRELDCARKRKCRRGSYGEHTFTFDIPKFTTPPSQSCGTNNTYILRHINDRMSFNGLNGHSSASSKSSGGFKPGASGKVDSVILIPMRATICIASTTLP